VQNTWGQALRISLLTSALVASLVGFGSTVALVLSAATALGATPAQTASWLLAVSLAKAVGSAALSTVTRIPVVLAWSTPGAALIAASTGTTMPEAVAAFILAGILVVLTGAIKPLGRLIGLIPDGVAAAMLAGVLLPFCLKGAIAAQAEPLLILPMVAVFVVARLFNPALAVLAALALGLALAFGSGAASLPVLTLPWPALTFIAPEIRPSVLLGLGVPVYLVTMASQNLPGFATLRAAGYEPPVRPALITTGALSAVTAFFGAHMVNMAAITAAICLGDDVHPDREQRWKVGLTYGAFWVVLGLLAPIIIVLLAALPPQVMTAIVALALLGPLMGALTGAFAHAAHRFAATITIAVAASGVAVFGIGAAFWGLLAGLVVYGLERLRR
jgi:benzoate membrane transport protein